MDNGQHGPISCVVDTDIAIDYLRGRDYARRILEYWAAEGPLAVSTVTHLEIYQGMRAGEEERTNAFLDALVAITVDVPVARRAGVLLNNLRSQGITIGIADAAVAATALGLGVLLLTNNLGHYPFPGLQVKRGLSPDRD